MRRLQRGFTVVEMLVAIAVAGLLVSLVYGAIRVGQRSVSALDSRVEQSELMRIGWQFVHAAIAHAGPVLDPARPQNRTGFEGTPDRLVFVANMPSYVGIEGPARITLGRVAKAGADQLLLTRERLDEEPTATSAAQIEQAVLVERLDELRIEYFGQTQRGVPPYWQSQWSDARRLPNLIRIQIRPAGARAWPLLIAAPQDGTTALDEDALPNEGEASDLPEEASE